MPVVLYIYEPKRASVSTKNVFDRLPSSPFATMSFHGSQLNTAQAGAPRSIRGTHPAIFLPIPGQKWRVITAVSGKKISQHCSGKKAAARRAHLRSKCTEDRTAGSCRAVAVRDATVRANREADRKYPDTKQGTGLPKNRPSN